MLFLELFRKIAHHFTDLDILRTDLLAGMAGEARGGAFFLGHGIYCH